jgi:hypothetical protein
MPLELSVTSSAILLSLVTILILAQAMTVLTELALTLTAQPTILVFLVLVRMAHVCTLLSLATTTICVLTIPVLLIPTESQLVLTLLLCAQRLISAKFKLVRRLLDVFPLLEFVYSTQAVCLSTPMDPRLLPPFAMIQCVPNQLQVLTLIVKPKYKMTIHKHPQASPLLTVMCTNALTARVPTKSENVLTH